MREFVSKLIEIKNNFVLFLKENFINWIDQFLSKFILALRIWRLYEHYMNLIDLISLFFKL